MSNPSTAADGTSSAITFRDLGLAEPLLQALAEVGYEAPSPIQAATIPPILAGRDLLGQAQTGTGKTAAFALPILSQVKLDQTSPQALVLAPTRELAIQVAEAFQRYASHLPGFHVLPIYGGQSYDPQLRGLRRGVHVVVGTPGRLVDHLKRGTLKLDQLRWLVLDEADEMLRMGFVDEVEWILQQTPENRQIALFSATMPTPIRRIAQTYLRSPEEITIKSKTSTAANIRQRCWMVTGTNKLDALTRILEAEPFDGMIIFARTKLATEDLATRLQARGFAASALNGDVQQAQRERLVARLKSGGLDILVATDVAARGLDVERVSHVVNYDVPTDTESYVHRIGRTGRAGRSGEAILFIAPRERHLLRAIERATRQPIEEMSLPSTDAVNEQRVNRFKQRVTEVLDDPGARSVMMQFQAVLGRLAEERSVPMLDIAAALAKLVQGETPLLLEAERKGASEPAAPMARRPDAAAPRERREARPAAAGERAERSVRSERSETAPRRPRREDAEEAVEMEAYRVEVGSTHGVKPANLVGALANEAGLDSEHIGRIEIRDDHSIVQLPQGMPKKIYKDLQKVWVSGRQLRISRVAGPDAAPAAVERPRPARTAEGAPRKFQGAGGPRKGGPGARGVDKGPRRPRQG
ncbi:DEAD/DEAH box helicase [Sinimarinibacterium sp. CAU 1509]|uniref:DEAD/DEAH box helicase n=1 Tax=Sinimarinibacterium sp. CAU 1509 TaxID=2562283 RepID=UPI0010AC3B69|nr:DEAD/DEAH box helicase [Sinimarinibacterium sp. CAU 1509]TJY61914.1 DEAD/DEAH box helicase [Sinimarinibacterium sp. CAU 1509]